ncbi:MAG: D-aminoacylase [Saprospiraceae bacterium]|nr:D-aminoacylase [Saprospiraceae bacterium]
MKLLCYFLLCLSTISFSCTISYDLKIKDAQIIDGSGSDPFPGQIGIRDQRIKYVGRRAKGRAKKVISASGRAVAPGFIDLHAHIEPITLYPDAKSHIMQGVTTALGGPDGGSPFPLGRHMDTLEQRGIGINVAYLIGHNTIRNHVMGLVNREPSGEELREMEVLVDNAMREGAFGISTGLKYIPGAFANTDEVIRVSKIAAKYGGIYTSHLREEGLKLLEGVKEAIDIARATGMLVVLTHHKAIGQPMWGASQQTLQLVDRAREEGLDVRMDQYPYTASHTGISIVIPSWALEGGQLKFTERCQDPDLRDSIRAGIIYNLINDRGGNDLRRIQFSKINWKPEFAGKTLHDLVVNEGMDPNIENGADMIIEIQLHRGANCIYHVIDSSDVVRIMRHPMTMIASDGRITQFGDGHPHPRAYGTFPRVLGYYSRELGVLQLTDAVRKMTALPAETLGLTDRGLIKDNFWADLVIFDPQTIKDKATFTEPHQYPEGIEYVILNGQMVVEKGVYKGGMDGKVLRKTK